MPKDSPTPPGGSARGTGNFTKRSLDLASKVVRLAHENPKFRQPLRPLLEAIASKKGGLDITEEEYRRLSSFGERFGVVSAHQGANGKRNQILRAQLLADLTRLGYRKASPLRGDWPTLPSDSLYVQNIRPEDLFELGRKYDQELVIYQAKPGLMGFYYTKGEPRARVVVDPKGDTVFRSVSDMTPYSRAKGLDLGHGLLWSKEFPWDGHTPLSRKLVRQMLKRDELTPHSD